jgi:hypothetical protein
LLDGNLAELGAVLSSSTQSRIFKSSVFDTILKLNRLANRLWRFEVFLTYLSSIIEVETCLVSNADSSSLSFSEQAFLFSDPRRESTLRCLILLETLLCSSISIIQYCTLYKYSWSIAVFLLVHWNAQLIRKQALIIVDVL